MEMENEEEDVISMTPCTNFVRRNLLSSLENSKDSGCYSLTPGSDQSRCHYDSLYGNEDNLTSPGCCNNTVESTPDMISGRINYYSYLECKPENKRNTSTHKNGDEEMMESCCDPVTEYMECVDKVEEKSVYMDCKEESIYFDAQDLPSTSTRENKTVDVKKDTKCSTVVIPQIENSSTNFGQTASPPSSVQETPKKNKSPKRRKHSKSKLVRRKSLHGFECIDMLYFLGQKEYYPLAVTKILSYLSDEDLLNVCSVSKTWNKICMDDPQAKKRLVIYKRTIAASKENMIFNEVRKKNGSRLQFSDIQNICQDSPVKISSPVASPRTRRFREFIKEGKKCGKESKLIICPECKGPVRCSNAENKLGLCEKCHYKFCTSCLSGYHYNTRCFRISSVPSISQISRLRKDMLIGSKASKRRLSRT